MPGGDGAWIFIDGKLVIDLGGVRSNVSQYADLDRLGLVNGQEYEMRLFYANRNSSVRPFGESQRASTHCHRG